MFKKTIITTALLVLATPAFAETVRDHYKTVIDQKPYNVEVCKDVRSPLKNDTEGAILGGILGGVIGNQFGNGNGKDAMTGLGAITGAILGGKPNQSGGSLQRKCQVETRYEERQREVYSHSTVTFRSEGKTYTLSFQN